MPAPDQASRHSARSRPSRPAAFRAVLGLLLFAIGAPAAAEPLDEPPGRLVDVGGHALHLDCRGRGGPTVVFESGLGGLALEWDGVRLAAGRAVRTCAYDRAGYGWSESGPLPRSAARSAAELHALLGRSGEQGPFVVVAHSYGGLVARLFAERHPDEVAAIILLDASAPEQFARLPESALPRVMLGALERSRSLVHSTPRPPAAVPAARRTLAMRLMMLPKARRAWLSELRHFEASAARVARQRDGLLSAPLIVVSRARREFGDRPEGRAAERRWHAMQRRMTALSRRSDHWIAVGAGHVVHADRADLVVTAIHHAVNAASQLPGQGGGGALHLAMGWSPTVY